MMRRALVIDEASYGLNHPNVAIRLSNLAQLLQDVFSQAKIRKKSCKNPKFIFRKSEKNHKSFLPHEGMFHSVTFPLK